MSRAQAVAVAACVMLWAVSLALPALEVRGGPMLRGIDVLYRGWQGFDSGVYSWLANPLFVLAAVVCFLQAWRAALALAIVASVAGLTSFGAAALAARSGTTVPAFAYAPGFYVWLSALLGLAACAARGAMPRRDAARS